MPGKEGTPISHLHRGKSLSLPPAPVLRQSQPPAGPFPRKPTLLYPQGTPASPQEGPLSSQTIQSHPDPSRQEICGSPWEGALCRTKGCAEGGGSRSRAAAGYPQRRVTLAGDPSPLSLSFSVGSKRHNCPGEVRTPALLRPSLRDQTGQQEPGSGVRHYGSFAPLPQIPGAAAPVGASVLVLVRGRRIPSSAHVSHLFFCRCGAAAALARGPRPRPPAPGAARTAAVAHGLSPHPESWTAGLQLPRPTAPPPDSRPKAAAAPCRPP